MYGLFPVVWRERVSCHIFHLRRRIAFFLVAASHVHGLDFVQSLNLEAIE
jgi:hypothetical protein